MNPIKTLWDKHIAWRPAYLKRRGTVRKYLKNYEEVLAAGNGRRVEKLIFKEGYEFSLLDQDTGLQAFYEIFMDECYQLKKTDARTCIVDLGANTGFFSLYAHIKQPNARIFSVEASPATAGVLAKNISVNHLKESIEVFNLAVSDRAETVPFFVSGTSGWSSLFNERGAQHGKEVSVEGIRFSNFCKQQNIKHVDFLKIDIEGAEFAAVLGDEAFFDVPIQRMVLEVDKDSRDSRWSLEGLLAELKKHYKEVNFLHTYDEDYPLIACENPKAHD